MQTLAVAGVAITVGGHCALDVRLMSANKKTGNIYLNGL